MTYSIEEIQKTIQENVAKNRIVYDYWSEPPEGATTPIAGGRLKGFTNIKPQWRVQVLTEIFGMCGIGWYYRITSTRMSEPVFKDNRTIVKTDYVHQTVPTGNKDADGNPIMIREVKSTTVTTEVQQKFEQKVFVDLELYVRNPETGEWSEPILGSGGSSFVAIEKGEIVVNDECWKSAKTDAISVACQQLGIASNVYMNSKVKDGEKSKYDTTPTEEKRVCSEQDAKFFGIPQGTAFGKKKEVKVAEQPKTEADIKPPIDSDAKPNTKRQTIIRYLEEKDADPKMVDKMAEIREKYNVAFWNTATNEILDTIFNTEF